MKLLVEHHSQRVARVLDGDGTGETDFVHATGVERRMLILAAARRRLIPIGDVSQHLAFERVIVSRSCVNFEIDFQLKKMCPGLINSEMITKTSKY